MKPSRIPFVVSFALTILFSACREKGGSITLPGEQLGTQHYVDWPGLAKSPWPMFMHDPQHTGRSPYKGPQAGTVQWRFDATSWVYSSPVIDEDGTIYVGSDDGNLYAINQDGSLKWKYQTLAPIIASPLIASDGTIYAAQGVGLNANNGVLYAFDRSGNVKWKFQMQGIPSQCAPTISKDGKTVLVSAFEVAPGPARLYAISNNGILRWTFEKNGNDKLYIYSPAFSPDGTTLYVPGLQKLYAVDTSGSEKWEFNTSMNVSSPCVDDDGNIYFVADKFYSTTSAGTLRWSAMAPATGEPPAPSVGWDGSVFVSYADYGPPSGSIVHAYTGDGVLKWMQYVGGFSQGNPISDIDGTVYIGSVGRFDTPDSTNFYAISNDGTKKFRIILRSPDGSIPDIDSTPAIDLGGRLYVGCDRPQGFHLFAIH